MVTRHRGTRSQANERYGFFDDGIYYTLCTLFCLGCALIPLCLPLALFKWWRASGYPLPGIIYLDSTIVPSLVSAGVIGFLLGRYHELSLAAHRASWPEVMRENLVFEQMSRQLMDFNSVMKGITDLIKETLEEEKLATPGTVGSGLDASSATL